MFPLIQALVPWLMGRFSANLPLLSALYIWDAIANCLRLFRQPICWPLALPSERAGSSKAARMAIMAITTSVSIKVNARRMEFVSLGLLEGAGSENCAFVGTVARF